MRVHDGSEEGSYLPLLLFDLSGNIMSSGVCCLLPRDPDLVTYESYIMLV